LFQELCLQPVGNNPPEKQAQKKAQPGKGEEQLPKKPD
jgi:hypothetical protein